MAGRDTQRLDAHLITSTSEIDSITVRQLTIQLRSVDERLILDARV